MRLSRDNIYRIIIEECIKDEGLLEALSPEAIDKLLRRIMGDKKFCDQYPERCAEPEDGRGGDTALMPTRTRRKPTPLSNMETMPLPVEGDIEAQIANLLGELPPEEAMEVINNVVSQNYPQFSPPECPDEEGPDPDRPVVLSPGDPRRKAIREMVLKILSEYGF